MCMLLQKQTVCNLVTSKELFLSCGIPPALITIMINTAGKQGLPEISEYVKILNVLEQLMSWIYKIYFALATFLFLEVRETIVR